MYGVSNLKLGLYGVNCSSGRAITLVPNAGPALLAQLVVVRLAARCSSVASMRLLLLLPPRPPWPRARCESPALALGIASLLIGFCVAAGFSGACEGPGRSFHPTAVERRNGPSAPRWVENKLNEINGMRQIEGQPPHRAGGIELLGHRHERHTLCVEDLNQPGKIGERAGQPVDLVDDDDVDPAFPDVGEQALQSGPLDVATREPATLLGGPGQCPALVTLTADVGLAGFALRLERVELLLEPFLGRFAGVDRAALAVRGTPRDCWLAFV